MLDPIDQFREAMQARGLVPPVEIQTDGEIHRCNAEGRGGENDGAYLLHLDGIPAGGFENWRDGAGWENWRADIGRTLTYEEEVARRAHVEAVRKTREAEDRKRKTEARELAKRIWDSATPCTEHPYLVMKGVKPHGARIATIGPHKGDLVLPLRDSDKNIHSLQFINDAETDNKRLLPGGRKQGCFFSIGKPAGVLYVAEGFATAASIHEATGQAVAVAFDAGNLLSVAKSLKAKHPDLKLVFAADDDHRTDGNPGLTKATEAAAVVGATVAIPEFGPGRSEKATDFNDLHQAQGLETVKKCIEGARLPDVRPDDGHPEVPGFEWGPRGLYQVKDAGKDEEGKPKQPQRTLITPPFALPGLVRDMDSQGWRVLIAWNDLDGIRHEETVPFDLLSGEGMDLARILAQGGLVLPPDPGSRKALLRYLCGAAPKLRLRVRLVDALGWHEGAFVLPDGKTIGQAGEVVRFAGDGSALHRRSTSGTLESWQTQIAAYAVGEPRLAFGIACAFAGPLLALVRPDGGGGFNIQGFSSKGKSTILEAAASVWHCPAPLPTWRATSNGLEGIAATRNDGFLPLDEMGQVDAKEAGQVAYMLANGTAKVRATKDGGTRSLKQWRVIFLSTGELGIEDKLSEDGKRAKAGQEVRVPDIPCPAAGMLEDPHGFPDISAFAEHLKASARRNYGHAARAFLTGLCDEWGRRDQLQAGLKAMEAKWMTATIPAGVDAQVHRVGGRFALVAVAGELALRMGILPWPEGESYRAAAVCFKAWLERRGFSGASEVHRGIAAALSFLEKHGMSRFDEWGDREARPINRAGTRKRAEGIDGWDFFITKDGWKEACQGSSARDIARACAEAGILEADGEGKLSHSVTIPGQGRVRCYIIRALARAQFLESESA